MPIGVTKEVQELNDKLVKELVGPEVLAPMEKIGWGHGAPPAPVRETTPPAEGAQTGQPAPAATGQPPAPVATPKEPVAANTPELLSQLEEMKDPTTGLYFGKYKTPQEAIKGVGHAVTMAKDAFKQRDAARAENVTLRSENDKLRLQPPANAGVSQPSAPAVSRTAVDNAKAKLANVLKAIAEDGGTLDGENASRMLEAQSELSRAEAEYTFAANTQATTADAQAWKNADAYMKEHYPDSLNFVDEIGVHIDSDPLLQEAVAALVNANKREKASELAWKSYKQAAQLATDSAAATDAATKEQQLAAGQQVRQELVDQARKDAGIVGGSAGGAGAHEKPPSGPSPEEAENMRNAMRREGMTPGTAAGAAFRRAFILDPATLSLLEGRQA